MGADIKERKRHHRLEKQKLIDDFNNQISTLEKKLSKKQEDIVLMQNELQHVKVLHTANDASLSPCMS